MDYQLQKLALKEEALLWGGWRTKADPKQIKHLGWAVGSCVPQDWGKACVAELLDLDEVVALSSLPFGPIQALLNLLFPHEIINGVTVIRGKPPSPLGREMMLAAHKICYKRAIERQAAEA